VQYKFEAPPPAGRGGGGRGGRGGAGADSAAAPGRAAGAPPQPPFNPKPICAVIAGNLYNDDKILSLAHQYQTRTEWHTKRPNIG
jgi:hypothetical protein